MRKTALILVALLAFSCKTGPPTRLAGDPPRHVFLIVVDTLRADHLGFHGHTRETSPFLDELARDSAVWEQSYAASSNTLESVFAILGSASPLSGDLYEEGVPGDLVSVQQAFAGDGFNTLAVIGNPWLKFHERFFADGFAHRVFVNQERGEQWGVNTTVETTEIALQYLESKFDRDGRNFFYIHYLDPHDVYAAPEDFGFHRGPPPQPRPLAHVLSGEIDVHVGLEEDPTHDRRPTPAAGAADHVEFLEAAYDGEIRFLDGHLERLFERLETLGVLDDSLVLITSDHGEEFLEHGLLKHGFHLYDETLRVPWMLYGPAFVGPGRDQQPVSGIDVAPTLLDLAGVPVPATMLGRNVMTEAPAAPVFFASHFLNQDLRGIRSGRYKIIENRRTGTFEFYDLVADPGEQSPLDPAVHEAWPGVKAEFDRTVELYGEHPAGRDRLEPPVMDEETREQLKSLGYVN